MEMEIFTFKSRLRDNEKSNGANKQGRKEY